MIRNLILLIFVFSLSVSLQAQTPQAKMHVEFEGNKIFSSGILLKKFNYCVAKFATSVDKYDADLFEYCLRKDVLGFMRSQGYLNAKIGKPAEQNDDRSLNLTIPIEEGLRYRLGSIHIQSIKVFSSEQLLEKLNLKTGDIADGQELNQWLYERVKKLYENKGYIQSDFDSELTFKPDPEKANEGVADLKVVVHEGQSFVIGRIEFVGNAQTSDRVLRSALLIKEDETFNQQLFNESVEKLNSLGLFEWVDKEKDVELITDNESPLLIIKIQVKEIKSF
jgi:outer membrane protein insertion porin family